MREKLTSIVMPVFNTRIQLLNESIESVISQSKPFELIIVDDGSDQSVATYLDKVEARYPNLVQVVHQPNQGVSRARNNGLTLARGHYVAFIDSDDTLAPSFLEEATAILEETGADIVLGGMTLLGKDGSISFEKQQLFENGKKYRLLTRREMPYLIASLFNGKALLEIGLQPALYVSNCSALYTAEVIRGTQYKTDIAISEDRFFNWDAFRKAGSVALSSSNWYEYRENPQSASHRLRPHAREELTATANMIAAYSQQEKNPIALNAAKLGIVECFNQALNFSILRKGFYRACRVSKTTYVAKLIREPVFKDAFRDYEPENNRDKAIKFAIAHQMPFALTAMLLTANCIYGFAGSIKRHR